MTPSASPWRRPVSTRWPFFAALAAPLLVGSASALVTAGSVTSWYRTIATPEWNPPNAVFGPVWTALYIGMGIAFALVVASPAGARRSRAMVAFIAQLILNGAWTMVFFGLHAIGPALAIIIGLWLAIAVTLVLFERVKPVAFALLVPYLAWVSFASVLNGAIWLLNAG